MEIGESSIALEPTGSKDTLQQDDELYYYLLEGGATPSWAKEQLSILNRMRYLKEQNSQQRVGSPFFQQCDKCGKFTSYQALDHDCYQDRCALCGRWSDSRHVCSSNRCPACGEFAGGLIDHVCNERWPFRCQACGLFTGSNKKHTCGIKG